MDVHGGYWRPPGPLGVVVACNVVSVSFIQVYEVAQVGAGQLSRGGLLCRAFG